MKSKWKPADDIDEGEMELEDQLSDLTADLVASRFNETFLERLFAVPTGQWLKVESLCRGLEIQAKFADLRQEYGEDLQVCWLEHPSQDSGFCLILFYVESLHWNNLALYNKTALMKRFAVTHHSE